MARSTHPSAQADFADRVVADTLDDALSSGARVYGIVGLQGSGKSTLAAQVAALAERRGLRGVTLSIDDCYLDRDAREALGRDVHPLLATRGPPGTHDLALACATLDALRAGERVAVPRFDKLGDRRLSARDWPQVDAADLILFEGWCLKVPAQDAVELLAPLNALERDEDRDGRWRQYCNAALARDYPALWARIDRLMFLHGPGFDRVQTWRWQQERAMSAQAHADGRARRAMTREDVARFVQHFERVSRQAQRTLPAIAERVLRIDAERRPLELS